MEKQNISVQYSAKITDIVSVNSSFDRGELWIAYEGKNRNGSFISKRAFEKSAPTLAYCPVVVNYDIEEEHFGGHDVDLVSTDDGVRTFMKKWQDAYKIRNRAEYGGTNV